MKPGDLRCAVDDLRARGAGETISSEVLGHKQAAGGSGGVGGWRKRRRRSRFAAAVQDTMVAVAASGRFWETIPTYRGMPAVNIMIFNEFRLFPMISNQFQSLLKK